MKIIDILSSCASRQTPCLSFEYYPPKSREKWDEFYEKIDRMNRLHPNFIDVTWGTGDPTSLATLEIAEKIQSQKNIETMMHVTCTHRSKTELLDIIAHVAQNTPIRNIMALRGNRLPSAPWQPHPDGFRNAAELIAGIRERFGDTFCISAAGYPEGHRDDGLAPSKDFVGTADYYRQIDYLRKKIDVGGQFIVTQLCFDLDQLCRYRDDCLAAGITCPIVPGILPIFSEHSFEKIASFSASIPKELSQQYHAVDKSIPGALESFAIDCLLKQIDFLHRHGFYAVHLYTLNHEKLISKALAKQKDTSDI